MANKIESPQYISDNFWGKLISPNYQIDIAKEFEEIGGDSPLLRFAYHLSEAMIVVLEDPKPSLEDVKKSLQIPYLVDPSNFIAEDIDDTKTAEIYRLMKFWYGKFSDRESTWKMTLSLSAQNTLNDMLFLERCIRSETGLTVAILTKNDDDYVPATKVPPEPNPWFHPNSIEFPKN